MSAIDFVIRSSAGSMRKGEVDRQGVSKIQIETYSDVSLHAEKTQLRGYTRDGKDLIIDLADGTKVVLEGFFLGDGTPVAQLYLSAGGEIQEVTFNGSDGNILFAQYSDPQPWQKWSDVDGLVFFDRAEPMVFAQAGAEGEASMLATLAPGLLGGGAAGLGAAGALAVGAVGVSQLLDGSGSGAGDNSGSGDISDGGTGDGGNDNGGGNNGGGNNDGGNTGGGNTPVSPNNLTANKIAGGTDKIVNEVEAEQSIEFHGTATPDSKIDVLWAGATKTVYADADGKWSATFDKALVPENAEGIQQADVLATFPDGTTDSKKLDVQYDTVVRDFAINDPVEGDDIINSAERADGVPISGTAEPASEIVVELNDLKYFTKSDADGNWSVDVPAANLPTGTHDLTVKVTATDPVGNVDTLTKDLKIDTEVQNFAQSPVNGGDVVSAMNTDQTAVLSGTVEPGSTVVVTIDGEDYPATVTGSTWTLDLPQEVLDTMEGKEDTLNYKVKATDPVGNSTEVSGSFDYDFDAPDAPTGVEYTRNVQNHDTTAITVSTDSTDIDVKMLKDGGSLSEIKETVTEVNGNKLVSFEEQHAVPDGSALVVTAQDNNGNYSSTLFVTEDDNSVNIALDASGLQGKNLQAVDLSFVSGSELTITEADLKALEYIGDAFTVHGDSNDNVVMAGAQKQAQTEMINGQQYHVYTFGDAVKVIVDDEINVST